MAWAESSDGLETVIRFAVEKPATKTESLRNFRVDAVWAWGGDEGAAEGAGNSPDTKGGYSNLIRPLLERLLVRSIGRNIRNKVYSILGFCSGSNPGPLSTLLLGSGCCRLFKPF